MQFWGSAGPKQSDARLELLTFRYMAQKIITHKRRRFGQVVTSQSYLEFFQVGWDVFPKCFHGFLDSTEPLLLFDEFFVDSLQMLKQSNALIQINLNLSDETIPCGAWETMIYEQVRSALHKS